MNLLKKLRIKNKKAFSLIEILVVLVLVGVLAGFLVPALQGARENAKRIACVNNLRQIYFAVEMYSQDHNGSWINVSRWMPLDPTDIIWNGMTASNLGVLYPQYIDDIKVFWCPGRNILKNPDGEWVSDPYYFGQPGYKVRTNYYCYVAPPSQGMLSNLGNTVISRDSATWPFNQYPNHKYGYNALYGNGSVVWANF